MVYFPESVIIVTQDNIQFKSFANEHPPGFIIAKPKYIPVETIFCEHLQLRNLFYREYNRLDMWINKEELKYYLDSFIYNYPDYVYNSSNHKNWFFAIPKNRIKQIFDPKQGLKTILNLPKEKIDSHIQKVIDFTELILHSGVKLDSLGITFSTAVGHYDPAYSDINIVIYGKKNGWKVVDFLGKVDDPRLKWKTEEDWINFWDKRNRKNNFTKEQFIKQMNRKKTEGFFDDTLFILFNVEKENETWNKWGEESYEPLGLSEIEGIVTNNYSSLVRPGCYEIKNSKILFGKQVPIKKIVFYSRDYVMQALPGEKIQACGLLEKVTNLKTKKQDYRLVTGYFDSYLNERRGIEFIKKIK